MTGIFDNFLKQQDFNKIHSTLTSDWMPWYYNNMVTEHNEKEHSDAHEYQFTHMFYNDNEPYSDHFPLAKLVCDQIEEKLGRKITLIRIKANFRPVTLISKTSDKHRDCVFLAENGKLRHTTAILYITTNNGLTILSNGDKIENVANRLLVFDANEKHRGTTATDNHKIVINFNYY